MQLLADAVAEHERVRARGAAVARVDVDDRRDIERAHVRMLAGVRGAATGAGHHVDALDRHARAAQQRVHELVGAPGEREHRAVVVGIGVDVQHARPVRSLARERGGDHGDRVLVAPLRDVRHRQQDRWAHRATRLASRALARPAAKLLRHPGRSSSAG